MQAIGLTKPRGAVKAKSSLSALGTIRKAQSRDFQSTSHCWEYAEHKCWDPNNFGLIVRPSADDISFEGVPNQLSTVA